MQKSTARRARSCRASRERRPFRPPARTANAGPDLDNARRRRDRALRAAGVACAVVAVPRRVGGDARRAARDALGLGRVELAVRVGASSPRGSATQARAARRSPSARSPRASAHPDARARAARARARLPRRDGARRARDGAVARCLARARRTGRGDGAERDGPRADRARDARARRRAGRVRGRAPPPRSRRRAAASPRPPPGAAERRRRAATRPRADDPAGCAVPLARLDGRPTWATSRRHAPRPGGARPECRPEAPRSVPCAAGLGSGE